MRRAVALVVAGLVIGLSSSVVRAEEAAGDPIVNAVRAAGEATVKAFNAGDVAALAGTFLESAELVDEEGNVYAGRDEIAALFTKFFEKYPGAVLEMEIDSARPLGDEILVEEGLRRITVGEAADDAQVRYVAIRAKQDDGRWPIASYREFSAEPPPTPHEMLEPAAWLVGDWVDESPAGRTEISFRWSPDGNYLMGEYNVSVGGKPESTSTQRIGWDPVEGQLRSWTFDSDGGYSQGEWTATDTGWVVRSEATMPDGTIGSAHMTISVKDPDHFVVRSTDRIVGGALEPDFEMTVARKPPAPAGDK